MLSPITHPTAHANPGVFTELPEFRWQVLVLCPPDALRSGWKNGIGRVTASVWQGASFFGFRVQYDGDTHAIIVPPAYCFLPNETANVAMLAKRRAA